MRREVTTTRSSSKTPSRDEAGCMRRGRFVDEKAIFAEPIAYLRSLGIEAELVEETAASFVPAA